MLIRPVALIDICMFLFFSKFLYLIGNSIINSTPSSWFVSLSQNHGSKINPILILALFALYWRKLQILCAIHFKEEALHVSFCYHWNNWFANIVLNNPLFGSLHWFTKIKNTEYRIMKICLHCMGKCISQSSAFHWQEILKYNILTFLITVIISEVILIPKRSPVTCM
jgi:hypothetical protein